MQTPLPSRGEFIAIVAATMSVVAFAIDSMLPSLPFLAERFSPDDPKLVQFVITAFLFGMGGGTLVAGPMSDAFGRKRLLVAGSVLFCLGAALASMAQSLEMLLIARLIQGIGAASPRVVALALVRDLFSGREMAKVMSFVMMIFTVVPALAPSIGAGLLFVGGWRWIFLACIIVSFGATTWLVLRMPETLPVEKRRPFQVKALRDAVVEMAGYKVVRLSTLVQSLIFGILFGAIATIQPIYDETFDRADSFPLWFGGIAILAISGSVLNSRLVGRFGMRALARGMLAAQVGLSALMLLVILSPIAGAWYFALFVLWQFGLHFQVGLTISNLNALAMEPVGHISGLAASVIGAISTVLSVLIAAPIGQAFDGTPMPLVISVCVLSALGVFLLGFMPDRSEDDGPTSGAAPTKSA